MSVQDDKGFVMEYVYTYTSSDDYYYSYDDTIPTPTIAPTTVATTLSSSSSPTTTAATNAQLSCEGVCGQFASFQGYTCWYTIHVHAQRYVHTHMAAHQLRSRHIYSCPYTGVTPNA